MQVHKLPRVLSYHECQIFFFVVTCLKHSSLPSQLLHFGALTFQILTALPQLFCGSSRMVVLKLLGSFSLYYSECFFGLTELVYFVYNFFLMLS